MLGFPHENAKCNGMSPHLSTAMLKLQTGPEPMVALRATFAVVLAAILGCAFYAAWNERGLYLDGVWILYRIAESDWFYLPAPARTTVDLIRQAPIVVLTRYTGLSLLHRGQIFSFVMSALPALLIVACWFITPRERKWWVLFPLAHLLIGVSATAFMPVTEASIASAYFWMLLFLLLFRARTSISQALFLTLYIPTFQLIEAACLLMPVLLLACVLRGRLAEGSGEQIFLAVSAALIVLVTIYQASWVIWPRVPGDRELFLSGIRGFDYLRYDGHVNLPLVVGVVAFAALTSIFVMALGRPQWLALSWAIVFGFAVFALAAVFAAFLVEQSFSPYSHYHARYFPVLVTLVLGTTAVLLHARAPSERVWMRPAILLTLTFLSIAQTAADVAATWHWREYVTDLQTRLSTSSGLISWERTVHTGDARRDRNWRLLDHSWLLPIMSIVWAKDGVVRSMIDWPVGSSWRPVDPEKPDRLPKLRGIDYRPYIEALRKARPSEE
jgi:hypothetical protein